MKFAVYVEGKAEMLFVADVLSKYSNYDSQIVGFQCINLNADDFENTVYHPYNKVQKIYQAVNATYGKHVGDYHSFLASLTKYDYEALRNSDRCASFKSFIESLLPSA